MDDDDSTALPLPFPFMSLRRRGGGPSEPLEVFVFWAGRVRLSVAFFFLFTEWDNFVPDSGSDSLSCLGSNLIALRPS